MDKPIEDGVAIKSFTLFYSDMANIRFHSGRNVWTFWRDMGKVVALFDRYGNDFLSTRIYNVHYKVYNILDILLAENAEDMVDIGVSVCLWTNRSVANVLLFSISLGLDFYIQMAPWG